jgi:hypothetical protein
MLKKTIIALLALVFAVLLVAPSTANAQVVVGVGVGRVYPRPYGYVAVSPGPYVVAPAPYVAVSPGYVYPYAYPGPVVVGGRWYPRSYAYPYRGYAVRHEYGWRR